MYPVPEKLSLVQLFPAYGTAGYDSYDLRGSYGYINIWKPGLK